MDIGLALFISVGALALFTFLAVAAYSENRTKERTEFHRAETLRKVAEQTGEGAEKVLEVIREEERIAQRKRHEGLKLGGLITTMVGLGLGIFLYTMAREAFTVAAIPLLIGLAMLVYVVLLAPQPE
ncbi:MAG: hypothetical protein GY716_12550 [bacterium]|nr:hypothetical protein [bacterium]